LQRHLTVCVHLNFTVFMCFFVAYCNCIVDSLQFRFRYNYFADHACHLAAFNRLVREYHHDFDFCFELCYLFSSLWCVNVHHYVFRLFNYCFQFFIVCIYCLHISSLANSIYIFVRYSIFWPHKFWYVNSILNFKRDKCYNLSLFKYYINWKDHFFTWKSFHLLNNCEQMLNKYHLVNSVVEESHVLSYVIF